MSKKKTDLAQKVMRKIRKDKIKMRPRIYFVMGSVILGIGMAIAVMVSTFLINIIVFRLQAERLVSLQMIIRRFPFGHLLVAVIAIWGGLALLKKYDVAYKKSYLGLALAFVALVVTLGVMINKTGVNHHARKVRQLHRIYGEEGEIYERFEKSERRRHLKLYKE